jgi:hypothetical protein
VFHDAYIGITTFFSRFWSLAQGAWGVRTLKLQVWRKLEITSSMFVEVISLSSLFFSFFFKTFLWVFLSRFIFLVIYLFFFVIFFGSNFKNKFIVFLARIFGRSFGKKSFYSFMGFFLP